MRGAYQNHNRERGAYRHLETMGYRAWTRRSHRGKSTSCIANSE